MNIKIFSVVLTYDKNNKHTAILSQNNSSIVLPMFVIEKPKFLHEEVRYLVKNLFNDPNLYHIQTIDISYMDVQNQLLINYIEDSKAYDYDENRDICLLCSIILTEKHQSELYWLPTEISVNIHNQKPIDLLLDHIIKYTVL